MFTMLPSFSCITVALVNKFNQRILGGGGVGMGGIQILLFDCK